MYPFDARTSYRHLHFLTIGLTKQKFYLCTWIEFEQSIMSTGRKINALTNKVQQNNPKKEKKYI